MDLPTIVAGGAVGRLRGGRHVKCEGEKPMANLLMTVLDTAGVPIDRSGDSTGRLEFETLSL